MEALDALERKVSNLLEELAALRADKASLATRLAELENRQGKIFASEQAKMRELEEALTKEKKLRQAVLERVEALMRRLEEQNLTG